MDYNFVEIGTSDFETLIENASDEVRGLSIEPIKYYLDRLPVRKLCQKGNFAVSDRDGEITIYSVCVEDIRRLGLPGWVRGCNSVNAPHPTVHSGLMSLGLDPNEIIKGERLAVKSFKTIVAEYGIGSIQTLKIDTEGHDVQILRGYLEACLENENLFAETIMFESNELANASEVSEIVRDFCAHGYTATSTPCDTYLSRQKPRSDPKAIEG